MSGAKQQQPFHLSIFYGFGAKSYAAHRVPSFVHQLCQRELGGGGLQEGGGGGGGGNVRFSEHASGENAQTKAGN